MANNNNIVTLDIAFHPGETLKEKLDEMNMSTHDFSEKSHVPEQYVVDIL